MRFAVEEDRHPASAGKLLYVLACRLLAVLAFTALPAGAQTQLISNRNPGVPLPAFGNDNAVAPYVTPDGRFVLYASGANNVTIGENNQLRTDVFLLDRTNHTTVLVSTNYFGTGGGNDSSSADIVSTNGRYVLYESLASDLLPGDTNGTSDVFLCDLVTGSNTLVSVSTNGGFGNGSSSDAVMTPDGRYVVFLSTASNLVPGDTNGIQDVFVRDLVAQTTTLVSVGATPPATGLGYMATPAITPDGNKVAFFSTALGLAPGAPTNSPGEIYLRDLVAGTTTWASTNAALMSGLGNVSSTHPVISDDGRFIAFKTGSTNGVNVTNTNQGAVCVFQYDSNTASNTLVASNAFPSWPFTDDIYGPEMTPDGRFIAYVAQTVVSSNAYSSVHVWDTQLAQDTLVSQGLGNSPSNTLSDTPAITPDGRYVTYLSTATNIVTNILSIGTHIYLRDLQSNTTEAVDLDTGAFGFLDPRGGLPSMSTNGQLIAFTTQIPAGGNYSNAVFYHVFLRDRIAQTTTLASAQNPAVAQSSGNEESFSTPGSLSEDGRWLVFTSYASDLVTNDFNANQDVFVRDMLGGSNILVSVGLDGNSANGWSGNPVMSADGRYVAFVSAATSLVMNDTNNAFKVVVRDLQAGTTVLASIDSNALSLGNGSSSAPVISANGRYLAFLSITNALAGTTTTFWRDLTLGETVSLGISSSAHPVSPSISLDGRYVGYVGSQLFVWDSQQNTNVYSGGSVVGVPSLAVSPNGTRLLYDNGAFEVFDFVSQSLLFRVASAAPVASPTVWSEDGRFVAFVTTQALAAGDTNATNDVGLYDFQAQESILVSSNYTHTGAANAASDWPSVSGDGRFVVFRSFATDIVPGITTTPNIFIYDRYTGSNTLVNIEPSASSWMNWTGKPSINGDGSKISYQSFLSSLVLGDLNNVQDLFAASLAPWGTLDSDGDGIPDAWMLYYFGHPTGLASDHSRAQDDADGNGMTNLQKFLAGLDPLNPASSLYLQISPLISGNTVTLTWQAVLGKSYAVQFKTHLNDPSWQSATGDATVVGTQGSFSVSPSQPSGFYRVAVVAE